MLTFSNDTEVVKSFYTFDELFESEDPLLNVTPETLDSVLAKIAAEKQEKAHMDVASAIANVDRMAEALNAVQAGIAGAMEKNSIIISA